MEKMKYSKIYEEFGEVKWSLRKKITLLWIAAGIAGGIIVSFMTIQGMIQAHKHKIREDRIVSIAKDYAPDNLKASIERDYKMILKAREFSKWVAYLTLILIVPIIVVVLLVVYIFTNILYYQPIDTLLNTANKISEGDLNQKAEIPRRDEFGLLAHVFNKMTESLKVIIEYQKTQINKILLVVNSAAHGDLTKVCEISSDDEFAELSKAINQMIINLRNLVMQVNNATSKLTQAAQEILASTEQQAAGVAEQSSQISQVASSLQELSATARQINENTQKVFESADKATKDAIFGGKSVENSMIAMSRINKTVEATGRKITVLGESSRKIGKVATTIRDIAEQTNLLALNAAIEAARAGEQGKGFAVVADEIRKLAEGTSQQLEEINNLITTIQTETNSTVMAMEEGIKSVDEGVKLINTTGDSLQDIISVISQTSSLSKEITISTNEQTKGSEQLSSAMVSLSSVMREMETIARQNANLAHELNSLSLELKQTISGIRLR